MTDTLLVNLNRDGPYAIHPETEVFETSDSFKVVLQNEGAGRHVDIQLTPLLANNAEFIEGTHFVENGATWSTTVPVDPPERPSGGTLTISTGYGRETRDIPIRIIHPEPPSSDSDQPSESPMPPRDHGQPSHVLEWVLTTGMSSVHIAFATAVVTLLLIGLQLPVNTGFLVGGTVLTAAIGVGLYVVLSERGPDDRGHRRR